MPPRRAPGSPSSSPATATPGVSLSTKAAGAPVSATPAVNPAGKGAHTGLARAPSQQKEFGDLYFQPTREAGESEEDYRRKLDNINQELMRAPATPKRSPGSFTLLTERKEKGYTGETRFDKEIQFLKKEQDRLRQEIRRNEIQSKDDPSNKDVYMELAGRKEREINNITADIDTLLVAGGEHYMTAKQDATFASSPRKMRGDGLRFALERAQHLTAGDAVRKIGSEVRERNTRELRELKGIVEEQATQIQELKDRVSDLMHGMKTLSRGKLPDHIKDSLVHVELTLKALKKAYDEGETFNPAENGDLEEMLQTVDDILNENMLGKAIEEEIRQETKTPADALKELADEGRDLTADNLIEKGIGKETAHATVEFLKKQGIIT